MFRKRINGKKTWSLTNYYNAAYTYDRDYIALAGKKFKAKVDKLPAGMAFVNDVNAMCIKSKFGNIIVVNETLSYFLYYMNLVFFGSELSVDDEDINAALTIAVRIMLGSEAMDFDLDSRGELPDRIHNVINSYTQMQLMFTFGHEYAHHTLNHLSSSKIKEININNRFSVSGSKLTARSYSYNHNKEYKADLQAIKNIKNNTSARNFLTDSAFFLFIYFDILDYLFQLLSLRYSVSSTHPKPLDRLFHLRRKIKSTIGFSKEDLEPYLQYGQSIKKQLQDVWVPYRIDELEKYGSAYLPSYKKGNLVDRVDY